MPVDSNGKPISTLKERLVPMSALPKRSSGMVSPVKHVSFDKDIISKKMEFFTDLVTHFNSISSNPVGAGIAAQAKQWLARQMASDIFSTLHLDRLEWEFDASVKHFAKPVSSLPKEDSIDSIILKEPVFEFLKKHNNYGSDDSIIEDANGILFNMDITNDILNEQKKDDEAAKRLKDIQSKIEAQHNVKKIKPTGKIIPEPKVEPGKWVSAVSDSYGRFAEPEDPRQMFRINFNKLQEDLIAKMAKHKANKPKKKKPSKKKTSASKQ